MATKQKAMQLICPCSSENYVADTQLLKVLLLMFMTGMCTLS